MISIAHQNKHTKQIFWMKATSFCVMIASFLNFNPLTKNRILLSRECVEGLKD